MKYLLILLFCSTMYSQNTVIQVQKEPLNGYPDYGRVYWNTYTPTPVINNTVVLQVPKIPKFSKISVEPININILGGSSSVSIEDIRESLFKELKKEKYNNKPKKL